MRYYDFLIQMMKKKRTRKEMDYLGLDDWKKDEVGENGWEPDYFDDDELEEGDYYYEDDN